MQSYSLPIIIGGEIIEPQAGDSNYCFTINDVEVKMPKINKEHLNKISEINRDIIHDIPVNEIITFLSEVGRLWRDEGYHGRKLLLELGPRVTGESLEMYIHNMKLIIGLISTRSFTQDILDIELRNRSLIDEWVPYHNAYIHAEPLGRLLHIMAGNIPIASVYSLVRGLLTKNVNIAKVSKRDMVTLTLFVKSFYDVDPNHPVTKTVSTLYWERSETEIIDFFMGIADGVCVWGGGETVRYYKEKAKPGTEILEYGPKRGAQIIRWDPSTAGDLVSRVARDISVDDQEACFSPQIIYLEGEADSFISELSKELERFSTIWPKGLYDIDHFAHANYVLKSYEFCGCKTFKNSNLDWLIVKVNRYPDILLEHPLGRTIFVYPLTKINDCLQYIDKTVQTIGVEPIELAYEMKDELTKRGVLRITNIGFVDIPRLGIAHDGIYINRLVRWVGLDRPRDYEAKIYDVGYEENIL